MNVLIKDFINFIKQNKILVVFLILVLLLSYGFLITNASFHIDDISFGRYFDEDVLFGQRRPVSPIIQKLTGIYQYNPFWLNGLAVIILFCSAIVLCIALKKFSQDKLSQVSLSIFAAIFVSYSLINEIFIYMTAGISISIGYLLVGIAIYFTYNFLREKKLFNLCIPVISIFLATGMYESLIVVYLCMMTYCFIIECMNTNESIKFKEVFKKIILIIGIATVALMIKIVSSQIIMILFNIEKNNWAQMGVLWGRIPFSSVIKTIYLRTTTMYILASVRYLPILIYVISLIIAGILSVVLSIKKKSGWIFVLFVGVAFLTQGISFVQGHAQPYRTCQSFAVFIGITFMILFHMSSNKKILKSIVMFFIVILVLNQSRDLSKWFYKSIMSYDYDKNLTRNVGMNIQKVMETGDENVVFIGRPKVPDWIKNYEPTNLLTLQEAISKVIVFFPESIEKEFNYVISEEYNDNRMISGLFSSWAITAFGERATAYHEFLEIHGYTFNQGDEFQYHEARKTAENSPVYPKDGSIYNAGEYIIVNFGY